MTRSLSEMAILPECPLRPRGIQKGILSWRHFGESGKNFIEIGKRPEIQETMLRSALPLETDGISQRRRINAKAQTWKKKLGSLCSRPGCLPKNPGSFQSRHNQAASPGRKHPAAAVELTSNDLREIENASSNIKVEGARYPEAIEKMTGLWKVNPCTRQKLIPLPVRHRRWPPPRSRGAIQPKTTYRSKSYSVVSAIPIFTRYVMSGANSCPPCTRLFRAMRSSAVSPRSAQQSPNSSPATSPRSAAWSTRTARVPSAALALSSSAQT